MNPLTGTALHDLAQAKNAAAVAASAALAKQNELVAQMEKLKKELEYLCTASSRAPTLAPVQHLMKEESRLSGLVMDPSELPNLGAPEERLMPCLHRCYLLLKKAHFQPDLLFSFAEMGLSAQCLSELLGPIWTRMYVRPLSEEHLVPRRVAAVVAAALDKLAPRLEKQAEPETDKAAKEAAERMESIVQRASCRLNPY